MPRTPDSCCPEGVSPCTFINAYSRGCLEAFQDLSLRTGMLAYFILGVAGIEVSGVVDSTRTRVWSDALTSLSSSLFAAAGRDLCLLPGQQYPQPGAKVCVLSQPHHSHVCAAHASIRTCAQTHTHRHFYTYTSHWHSQNTQTPNT